MELTGGRFPGLTWVMIVGLVLYRTNAKGETTSRPNSSTEVAVDTDNNATVSVAASLTSPCTEEYCGQCSTNCKKCNGPHHDECTVCIDGSTPRNGRPCKSGAYRGKKGPRPLVVIVAAGIVVLVVLSVIIVFVTTARRGCTCGQNSQGDGSCHRCLVAGLPDRTDGEDDSAHRARASNLQPRPVYREGESNVGDSISYPSKLMKKILRVHGKLTEEFNDSYLMNTIFQLRCIAIGYFDREGGSLSLDTYGVHLYIPRGALARGRRQMVYVYVDPTAPPVDGIQPPEVALSPVIQCGPPGLKFLDSVVLMFPHHAKGKTGWKLTAKICKDGGADYKSWRTLDGENDGTVVSTKDNRVVLLLKHFTGGGLFGEPSSTSSKIVKVGAFGGQFTECDQQYAMRIHVWNDDPVAEQKVVDMEGQLESKPLDAFREMQVCYSDGDVSVEVENIKSGWELEANTPKRRDISKSRIWKFPANSVTFDLNRQHMDNEIGTHPEVRPPGCDGYIYQAISETEGASNEDRVHLSIRPKQVIAVASNKKTTTETDGKETPGQLCHRCQKDTASEICSTCKNKMRAAFPTKVHGLMDGDYGGMSEKLVQMVCEILDADRDGGDWKQLAEDLLGMCQEFIQIARQGSPMKEVMKIYFATRRAARVPDRQALEGLIEAFREEAVQMVRDEVNRSDQPVKSAPHTTRAAGASKISAEIDDQKLFRHLATELGNEWETLATYLGLTNADLYKIKEENTSSVANKIFAMLERWRQRRGWLDKSSLADCLERAGRHDLAQHFSEPTRR